MSDGNFGLEDFSTYAARRENRSVPVFQLRARYDAAREQRKQAQIEENKAAHERRRQREGAERRAADEARQAADQQRRAAGLAALKEKAQAAFLAHPAASAADFERLWPRLRDEMLVAEARERDASLRESMRQRYGRDF